MKSLGENYTYSVLIKSVYISKQCMSASLVKCRKRRKNTLAEYFWSVHGAGSPSLEEKETQIKEKKLYSTGTQSNIIGVLSEQFSATSYHYYCNNSNIQKLEARTSCLIRSQFSQRPDKVDFGNDCLNGKHYIDATSTYEMLQLTYL